MQRFTPPKCVWVSDARSQGVGVPLHAHGKPLHYVHNDHVLYIDDEFEAIKWAFDQTLEACPDVSKSVTRAIARKVWERHLGAMVVEARFCHRYTERLKDDGGKHLLDDVPLFTAALASVALVDAAVSATKAYKRVKLKVDVSETVDDEARPLDEQDMRKQMGL
jgi:hypothetical protein